MNDIATPKPKKSVALSGVTAGNTALCTVGRTGNDLHYRGYDILDFADTAEFAVNAKGLTISDTEVAALPLIRHDWHGDWSYTMNATANE